LAVSRGSCKRCGAEVDWFKTRNGKSMPLDPEPVAGTTVVKGEPGNAVVRGDVVYVLGPGRSIEAGEELRVPHFDSCPYYRHGARGRQDATDRAHEQLDAEAEAREKRDNGFEKALREAGRPKPELIIDPPPKDLGDLAKWLRRLGNSLYSLGVELEEWGRR
jgi:hypothetical protein